ncbi:hypothetical protein LQV63_15640 [Paenibacillus profundus]|uniref:Uncharacterized protein n=1 Tax=Paenibacillus profundus TaxID=1173085 RepID=A0ABS8YMD3_9BACL|nr:hypothetical protein [Paenibacillus profundus]MCE5170739.1 hypothetical protein [Paenibacillus profundus]
MNFNELRDYSNTLEELLGNKLKNFIQMVEISSEELEDFYSYLYHDAAGGVGGYSFSGQY